MADAGVKVEIQALCHMGGPSFVTTHVITKTIRRDFG
jgi:hypothetical protein